MNARILTRMLPPSTPEEAVDFLNADIAELGRTGIALECAASTLNAVAQRVAAKQADVGDFSIAQGEYEYARDTFREQLGHLTGQSAAWIERVLAL